MRIALYVGKGTYVRDVKKALNLLKVRHDCLRKKDIRLDSLRRYRILLMPGGTTETILGNLDKAFLDVIRKFVWRGGNYIGICGGAFLAAPIYRARSFRKANFKVRRGLGIANISAKRLTKKDWPPSLKTVRVLKTAALLRNRGKKLACYYENGPMIKAGKGVETIAVYEDGYAALVRSSYGNGKVILFSFHPEGHFDGKFSPIKIGTLALLKKSIEFLKASQLPSRRHQRR